MSGWPGLEERVVRCADGNPGAARVLMQIYEKGPHYLDKALKFFEENSMQGQWVWIAYKDICKENLMMLCFYLEVGNLKEKIEATPDWKHYHKYTQDDYCPPEDVDDTPL